MGVLFSQVEKIECSINPFSFFEAGKNSFSGQRIFWSEPSRNFYIVGIGHTYTIDVLKKQDRLKYVKSKWQQLLQEHIVNSKNSLVHGTGPVLLGGFSFDPYKNKSNLWKDYSDGKLILPTFMLTILNKEAWLTTNVIVNKSDKYNWENTWLKKQKNLLLKNNIEISPLNKNYKVSSLEIEPEKWINSVANAVEGIKEGLIDKVVLARELHINMKNLIQVENVLKRLHEEQPLSYIFAFENKDNCFIGASPELLVRKNKDKFYTICLAGTAARGQTKDEDEKLANELLNDKKNLHEHAVVVDMIKNAMQKKCKEVTVPNKPALYKMRDVQHLYTPVVGQAEDKVQILDMVKTLHPTPALGGYPRDKALKMIREKEILDRGWYAAPVGWIDENGDGEFAGAIRSGLIHGNSASLFAGCGIVGNSDPEIEYKETQLKFKPMLSALI